MRPTTKSATTAPETTVMAMALTIVCGAAVALMGSGQLLMRLLGL